jgi:site-specific DNA-methyltransferase (adenine-specific)
MKTGNTIESSVQVIDQCFNEAFKTDRMTFMSKLADRSYTIGSVDPVYSIDGNSHRNNESRGKATKSKRYHNALWYQEKTGGKYFAELKRVTENQIIFGANYFPSICGAEFKTPRRDKYEQFIEEHPTNWIIWDKVNSTSSFNDCELIWVSFPVPTEIFYFMWSGMMQGKSCIDGLTMNGNKHKNQKRIHPTEKPFHVYAYLLKRFAKEDDTILDTHMGSGSQRIVCWDLNISYTGLEIDKQYFDDEECRFNNHARQGRLFQHYA